MIPLDKAGWLLDQIRDADSQSRDRLGFASLDW